MAVVVRLGGHSGRALWSGLRSRVVRLLWGLSSLRNVRWLDCRLLGDRGNTGRVNTGRWNTGRGGVGRNITGRRRV